MRISLLIIAIITTCALSAQQTGYYNGVAGKEGDELKAVLHNIIKEHTVYSYYTSKFIFELSDADPNNPDNVIQVYTGFSHDNSDYGTGGLSLNREHVWAKSHGGFADWLPMYSDVHNLKPSASSVNQDKGNMDFDNGGVQHDIATGCYYTDSTWEARDEVKGDIARIIFYMSTRYEGGEGETDLEVVDWNNTYPYPQHGKLSTLLAWNLLDPPDEFERNRNNVIFAFQDNRNPFIDNPDFVQLIWGGETANLVHINNIHITPEVAVSGEPVQVNATINSTVGSISSSQILWGLSYETLTNQVDMIASGDTFTGEIQGQSEGSTVYYKIVASDGTNENSSVIYNFYVPKVFTGELVSIYDIQGQQEESPYIGQIVSTSGIITADFGTYYFIQDGTGIWNGLFIYESGRNPSVGDSVIITGEISEYFGKTEMSNISDYYLISSSHQLPELLDVPTGEMEEGHESILIKVTNAICTDEQYQSNFYMWAVDDGSGELKIHNTSILEYVPTLNTVYDITGPMNWDYGEWKIELRDENDVVSSVDIDGPVVILVEPVISTNIKIMFDEAVEEISAEEISNYILDNDVVVESASQHDFNKAQVNLTVSSMSFNNYIMTISNIKDESGNVMEQQEYSFSWVGIDELLFEGKVDIYPNPANNELNIEFIANENADIKIDIMDISGRMILQQIYSVTLGLNRIKLGLNNVSQGIYFLNIAEGNSSLRYKIIVK